MTFKPGRLAGILIVTGWAVLLTTHLWRSHVPTAKGEDVALAMPLDAVMTQRGVFYRGSRIGYVRETLTPLKGGVRARQEGRFTLNVMGRERAMDISGSLTIGDSGELETFDYKLETTSGRSPFETEVRGRVEGRELELTIRSGDRKRTEKRALSQPIVLPLNLYYSLATRGLESGKTYRLRLFDPLTLTEGEAEIEILEPEIVQWGPHQEEAFRLRTRFSGLTTTAWVNEEGQILREETPLGWTLVKETPGSSLQARSGENIPEIAAASAIPAIGWVEKPDELEMVRLRLNRFPPLNDDARGGRQKVIYDEVLIELETLPPTAVRDLSEDEREIWLASDAFIQADDPEVSDLAHRLTEDRTPLEAAREIWRWVYENIRKTPTISIPNAAEVLEQRAGDCNEHTVLFTALARAANIPTRVCTGLAWSSGQFYYHAWPEIWIGVWVAVDPTFGQFPADPLHIRLLTGGLEKQYEVLSLLGRDATIEILEAR
jgi:hypothetical protein